MNEEELPGGQPGGEAPGSPHDVQHSGPPESGQPTPTTGERPEDPEELRRRRHRNLFIILLVIVVIALALVYYYSKPSAGKQAGSSATPPAAITVGQSTTGDINIYVNAIGTVTPVYTVTVYSQITGQVMSVHYREGQMVRKGDPLIDIDPRPYEATLTQAAGKPGARSGRPGPSAHGSGALQGSLEKKCHRQAAV